MDDAGRGSERSALSRTKDEEGAEVKDSPPVLASQSPLTQDLTFERQKEQGEQRFALARTKDEDGAEVKDSPPVLASQSQLTQDETLERQPLLKDKEKDGGSLAETEQGEERSSLARTKDEDGAEVKDPPPILALQSQLTQDLTLERQPLLEDNEKENVSLDEIEEEDLPLTTVFDFLHKEKGSFEFENLVKAAIEIVESMQYLHQDNIVHGGLETKSLVKNENGVVAISGITHFGGKTNWNSKAVKSDILHFGIVLWEMMTGEIPLEAAHKVLQQKISNGFERTWKENPPSYEEIMKSTTDLLLERISSDAHPILVVIIKRCWDSYDGISFQGIGELLRKLTKVEKKKVSKVPCF